MLSLRISGCFRDPLQIWSLYCFIALLPNLLGSLQGLHKNTLPTTHFFLGSGVVWPPTSSREIHVMKIMSRLLVLDSDCPVADIVSWALNTNLTYNYSKSLGRYLWCYIQPAAACYQQSSPNLSSLNQPSLICIWFVSVDNTFVWFQQNAAPSAA